MVEPKSRAMPSREQLRIWRNYVETSGVLRARLTGRLQSESSLSSGDYQVLLALSESDGLSLRSSELATLIGWERSRLSHHLGRMEKRGLIQRASCPDDTHGVDVRITDAGSGAFRSGSVPHLRAVREMFIEAFSPEQLEQLDDLTRTLQQHLGLEGES
ncbi:MarR family transcriptional regulator [Arthrobacter woluwensis]|uniref:MarR family winged helix-turn-helix transcriptional regulator n=1 Tax=Arthrobacter woluwensis TaxID=156980 RepID=UPI000D136516|nr:MarR family transcriptional regulator [Arthrobacter woluwensis]PSS42942.1 MarR family transcriptional regulator [Arthrobacter woluwensis]